MGMKFFLGAETPLGTMTVPIEVGAEFADVLAWLASVYGQVEDTPAHIDEETGVRVPATFRDRTPQELLRCLAEATGKGHAASVSGFMHARAVAAVAKPEVPVSLGVAEITANA